MRAPTGPMVEPPLRPRLGPIRAVTYAVPALQAVEAAYVGELGYRVLERGVVDVETAAGLQAPAEVGRPMLTLGPASGEPVRLRFVESAAASGWRALTTFGWNATEFVVQDLDDLADRLQGGAFEIIGPPRSLTRFPMIRAMQVIGPAGECCYFTEVGPGSGLDLAPALSFVGRVFIVVAAGPDADALLEPYRRFDNATEAPVATPVRVISDAHGLPAETLHRHGLVRLAEGTLIELDAYPASARPRPCRPGELAPGMAAVSFECSQEPAFDGPSACFLGAAGERIELVAPGGRSARKAA